MYRMTRVFFNVVLVMFFLLSLFPGAGLSKETYPNKPVSVIVTFGAGMMDTITRTICKVAEKEFGQPMVVENKPGGAGSIGMMYVLRSKPDGYMIGVTGTTNFLVNPHLQNLPLNILTDTTDVIAIGKYNFLLAVSADAPWKTFDDLIDFAKKNPGKFSYADPGVATAQHICMERIALKEGIKWNAVPFKGGGEAVTAVLGGHTQGVALSALETSPHIRAGKLKPLVILSDSRLPDFPDIPSVMDKGYNFAAIAYVSVFGPKGLPEPIRQKLEDVFKRAMGDPSYIEITKKFQIEIPKFKGGKDFSEYWKSKFDEMGKVIKTLGITGN